MPGSVRIGVFVTKSFYALRRSGSVPGYQERQRKRARERFERQRANRLERQRKIRKWAGISLAIAAIIALAITLPLTVLSGSSSPSSAAAKPSATASASASAAAVKEPATHCTYAKSAAGEVKSVGTPPATPDSKAAYTATISTNLGPITISLANSKATCTVNSFAYLAAKGYFSNTQCHRISDSGGLYMLQCGDPTAKAGQALSCSSSTLGTGGPGYAYASENLTGAAYTAGTVAMANSGTADSNGSQFFLVFKNSQLPASYTPFGTITSGLDILQNVAKAGTSCTYSSAGGGVPKDKVNIDSITVKAS
jgi:peptidyl-prolyl cis-trans isomerase B (cyclophilin B)